MKSPREHGTNSAYAMGCRCFECTQAHTEYARERSRGETRTVDATKVRLWLQRQDATMADVAELSGLEAGTLRAIRSGRVERTNRKLVEALEPLMGPRKNRKVRV